MIELNISRVFADMGVNTPDDLEAIEEAYECLQHCNINFGAPASLKLTADYDSLKAFMTLPGKVIFSPAKKELVSLRLTQEELIERYLKNGEIVQRSTPMKTIFGRLEAFQTTSHSWETSFSVRVKYPSKIKTIINEVERELMALKIDFIYRDVEKYVTIRSMANNNSYNTELLWEPDDDRCDFDITVESINK